MAITSNPVPKTEFDRDLSPQHPTNQQAAQERGLRYDPKARQYKDAGGCTTHDRFGQPH